VFDLETGMVRDIDTVNNCYGGIYEFGGRTTDFGKIYFFKQPVKMLRSITIIGFKLLAWQVSNPWDLGTKDFTWDGTGRVYLSGSRMFLADVYADNILTITGLNGSRTVEGRQAALDITDILNKNGDRQSIHLELKDTNGGWIRTGPLYIVQKTLDRQDLELPEVFPCPALDLGPIQKMIDDYDNDTSSDRIFFYDEKFYFPGTNAGIRIQLYYY
jgi:hypothetical protein